MTRRLALTTLTIEVLVAAPLSSAVTLDLRSPNWQEVPGTQPPSDEFFPVYVEINGLERRGSTRVFDMVGSETEYIRMEVDCDTKRSRQLRAGHFETETRVRYSDLVGGWMDAADDAVAQFVCSQ